MKKFRQFGGSTGAVLTAIGLAMQHPGKAVWLDDKMSTNEEHLVKYDKQLGVIAEKTIEALGLENLEITLRSFGCFIVSHNYGKTMSERMVVWSNTRPATAKDWEQAND